jgi:hypothetical protein
MVAQYSKGFHPFESLKINFYLIGSLRENPSKGFHPFESLKINFYLIGSLRENPSKRYTR